MAGEARNRVGYYLRFAYSHLQIFTIKIYDFLIVFFSKIAGLRRRLERWIKASRDHYTVLIVPQKKSTVKKISASSTHIRWAALSAAVVVFFCAYLFYHFLSNQRDSSELEALKRLSAVQKEQINRLASKVGDFERKMQSLRDYEQKIRAMADLVKPRGQYLGVGGPSQDGGANTLEASKINKINKSMDQLIQEASQRELGFKEIIEFLEKRKSILAQTPSIWPVDGWVTSAFGSRPSPFNNRREFHTAIDIAARSGKEIVAPADGIVSEAERRADLGNSVSIDHGNGISTSYGHMLKFVVHKGKIVKRGETIGYVGSTGRSTGSHLHYSVHLNGVPVNPRKFLP